MKNFISIHSPPSTEIPSITPPCLCREAVLSVEQQGAPDQKQRCCDLLSLGPEETQAGIKIAGRNINNLGYADDTTLMAESEELKSLLMKVKEESEKVCLKLNVQKTKIMASGPITSWEIDRETVGTVSDFIFLVSKITADGDCSHEIKRCLLLGRKVMTNLDNILKNRYYFANKGWSSQGYGFSSGHVWM